MKNFIENTNLLFKSQLFEDLVGFAFLVGIIFCVLSFPSYFQHGF